MRQRILLASLLAGLVALAGCQRPTPAEAQIVLPDGDAARGQQAFVELGCPACHQVADTDLPEAEAEGPVTIHLGGRVSRIKTYGDLVTSVINPSHKLARSFRRNELAADGQTIMEPVNDVMTVSQLIDIVTFLESKYEVMPRPTYRYPVYTYGSD